MLSITVQNSSVKAGQGPIYSATQGEYNMVLSGAGSWRFVLPADEPQAAQISHSSIILAELFTQSGVITLFRGPVRDKKLGIGANGEKTYHISGEDELGFLRESLIWDVLSETSWETPIGVQHQSGGTTTDMANTYDGDTGTSYSLEWESLADEDFVYTSFYAQFTGIRVTLGTRKNVATADVTAQYFNGAGWDNVSNLADGTASSGKTMAQNGDVTWDRPDDEVEAYHNQSLWYWVRMHVDNSLDSDAGTAGNQDLDMAEFAVRYVGPQSDEIDHILSNHAPSGWATSASYYDGTVEGTLDQFEGETVLEALTRIAKRSGEHFRISTTSEEVEWLRTTTPSSGIVATASSGPHNNAIIEKIDVDTKSGDRVTRVYAFAAGVGEAATDLSGAGGVSLPTGYTLESDSGGRYYLKNGTLETALGRAITRRLDVPDLVPIYGTGQNEKTSEALALATVAYMQQRADTQTLYRVRLSNVQSVLRVADTVRLVYHGVTNDGAQLINLNEELIVLRLTAQIDHNGIFYDLLLSDVARLPQSDQTILADIISQLKALKRRPQPTRGREISGLQSGIPQ
jgi:hypothetical protein